MNANDFFSSEIDFFVTVACDICVCSTTTLRNSDSEIGYNVIISVVLLIKSGKY